MFKSHDMVYTETETGRTHRVYLLFPPQMYLLFPRKNLEKRRGMLYNERCIMKFTLEGYPS